MGQVTKVSAVDDMREWLDTNYINNSLKCLTDVEVVFLFSNHVSRLAPYLGSNKEKRALEIWANYCLLEQV